MTTAAPAPAPVEFGPLFAQSWQLFKRNWIVSLPPIIAGIVLSLLFAAFAVTIIVGAFQSRDAKLTESFGAFAILGGIVLFIFLIAIALWAQISMYAMANAAWERGTATFGDGFAAFFSRAGAVFVAGIGVFGLALLAIILALPTLGVSFFALSFATLFILPAVVVGRRGGFDAIGESFRLIRRFFIPSLVAWAALYGIQYALSFIMVPIILPLDYAMLPTGSQTTLNVPPIPLIAFTGAGFLLYMVALYAYLGFSAIVQVGLYRDLSAQAAPAQIS
jgi:hypothetical protein